MRTLGRRTRPVASAVVLSSTNRLPLAPSIDIWVLDHQLGDVVGAPIDMVLSPHRAVQPDVAYVSKARRSIIEHAIMGAADLVAEIISPGGRHRDRIDKKDLYEQHGIQEYWLIDPEPGTVEVLFLDAGQYKLVMRCARGEVASSRLLPGFEVTVEKLFESGTGDGS